MPSAHHKSSKRHAAERVNAERKVQLEHARELVRLTNAVHPPPLSDPELMPGGTGAGGAVDDGTGSAAITAGRPEGELSADGGDDAKKDAAPAPPMSSAATRAAERRRVKGLLYQSSAFRALLQDAQPGRVALKRPASAVSVLRRSELSATSTSATAYDTPPAEHVPLIGRSAGGAQSSGLAAELNRSQKGMAARRALAQRKADILAANRAATRAEFIDAAALRAREIEELRTGEGSYSGGGESGSNVHSATHSRSASMSTSFDLLGTATVPSPRPPPSSSARRPASASSASSRSAKGGKQAYFGRRDAALVPAQRAAELEALAMAQAQAGEAQTAEQAQADEETHTDIATTAGQIEEGGQPVPREAMSEEQQLMEALLQQQQPTEGQSAVPDASAAAVGSHEEKEQYPSPFAAQTFNQANSVAPSPPLSVAAVVQQSFGPNSTRSSRLRFLASSSRAAGVLSPGHGGIPPRAYAQNVVAAVRLANAPGRHPRSAGMGFGLDEPVMMMAFEPNQWTKQPLEQLSLHTGPRHETLAAAMATAEAAAAAATATDHSESSAGAAGAGAAGSEPHKGNLRSLRAEREAQAAVAAPAVEDGLPAGVGMSSADVTHHSASSPMSSVELERYLSPRINHAFFPMRGASLSAGKSRSLVGSQSERRGGDSSSSRPPEPSSPSGRGTGGRKKTGELAAAGTRDSYAAPGDISASSYAVVRALRPVSFNATRPDVLRALPHHPEESRLFGNMWTPSSIITSADNLISKYAGGHRAT
jgi:hypothetical protein